MPYFLFFLFFKSFAPELASPQHTTVSTPVPKAVLEGIAATAGELKPPGNGENQNTEPPKAVNSANRKHLLCLTKILQGSKDY